MRHDDDPSPSPEPLYPEEAPRGFADIDGGYPVETHLEDIPTADPADATPPPASPVSGRQLHNPLPAPSPAAEEVEDWYGPEPARANWRALIPIAVLISATGLGIWLAIPSSDPTAAPVPSTSAEPQTPQQHDISEPPAVWHVPSRHATPARSQTASPRPATSRTNSPRPTSSTPRPTVRPSSLATVTITTRVTVTPRPSRAPAEHGPEEPPRGASPTPPACLTWSDCHDGPPNG